MSYHCAVNLAARIKAARLAIGLKKGELAKAAGVSPGAVTQWEDGSVHALKGRTLLSASRALKVNATWLNTGRGEMAPSTFLTDRESELVTLFRAMAEFNQETLLTLARSLYSNQPNATPSVVDPFLAPK
jgi:transcriptional regulator with XRE-family HTH domain